MKGNADMEDYGFPYSEEEEEEIEQDVDIENQYYNSKGLVETDPEGALTGFAEVVQMEPEKADWGFKALKQTVKLYYRLGRYKEMTDAYREMLTYIKSAVTRNYSEKSINNIMDFVSGSASQNFGLLQEFYQTTLKALEEAKNERLWFKTNLNLCKIWFDMREYGRMNKILKELYKSCQKADGTDDQKKGTQLLEVYAIEIQMYYRDKITKKDQGAVLCRRGCVEKLLVSMLLDNRVHGTLIMCVTRYSVTTGELRASRCSNAQRQLAGVGRLCPAILTPLGGVANGSVFLDYL
ncbi:COP9 signalosome complex subunit 2 [Tanacetum coccineum]|uniref:COP9 signalosome complex subunit 2 n=1 Tax=Tanacetum coccineum TaxID=301880 RepID=A0ABQ5DR56_9ASTR